MGAIEQSNAIYLSISNGKICRQVLQPTKTSVTRVNKNGKTVHEEFYKGWKGLITSISVKEHKEFGKFWCITLTDKDGDAILQMNYSSGYSSAFLKTLPNIDLKSEVNFVPDMKIEGDKKKTTVFITQHGQPVKWAYTKDAPNGLPPLKQVKVKGKITWDDSDCSEFLEKMVNETIVPQLKGAGQGKVSNVPVPAEVEEGEIDDKDLPF